MYYKVDIISIYKYNRELNKTIHVIAPFPVIHPTQSIVIQYFEVSYTLK